MLSMTGYGSGRATVGGYESRVELRVVNHKQIDVRVRGYGLTPQTQNAIDALCRQRLVRGRVELNVQLTKVETESSDVLDAERATAVWKALSELSEKLGAPSPTLETLIRVPGILASTPSERDQRAQGDAVEQALGRALVETVTMRTKEGAALASDMKRRLNSLKQQLTQIQSASPAMAEQLRDALNRRIQTLCADDLEVDPERLEREVVIFAARADITEETIRLQSHLAQLSELFSDDSAVGKRIDFLLQEVSREVNTIASKVSDATIAQTVVEMKSEVARLREQGLNIL